MGETQSKKNFKKRNEERENNIYREGVSQFPDRIFQLEQSIKVLGNNQKSSNTNIVTLNTATTVLGTNLTSTNSKVDSLTKSVETMTSKMEDTNSRTKRLYTKIDKQTDRIGGLITVMQKTEETKAKDMNLISSILQNISQFGQAPVNCNFVNRISHGSTESEIQTHT